MWYILKQLFTSGSVNSEEYIPHSSLRLRRVSVVPLFPHCDLVASLLSPAQVKGHDPSPVLNRAVQQRPSPRAARYTGDTHTRAAGGSWSRRVDRAPAGR